MSLIGLREDELTEAEREALAALLEDPEARREHDEALALAEALAGFEDAPDGPSADQVLDRARPRRRRWAWAAPLLMAAAALLVVGTWTPEQRTKGGGAGPQPVVLEAAAEGVSLRALQEGAEVGADERILFQVRSGPGDLVLTEIGPDGRTEIARWKTPGGVSALGGATPLAWTSTGSGPRRYVVEWCDEGGEPCAEDELVLRWSSP